VFVCERAYQERAAADDTEAPKITWLVFIDTQSPSWRTFSPGHEMVTSSS
jgi:hypothetical protein